MAQIQLGKGQTKEAEKIMKEVIAAHPDEPNAYTMLVGYYFQSGKTAEGQETLTAGLAALPDNFSLNLTQAGLYESEQKYDDAIKVYEKLLVIRPNSEIVVNNLASLIAETADSKESLQRAYTLAKRFRSSKVPYFKDTLGWIHYRLGEYDLATPLIQEAAQAVPNMPILRYHLGMAYGAENRLDEAILELEAALKLSENQGFAHADKAQKALEEFRKKKQN
jgi:tetratricopeptide (TPR) repeat protein